MSSLRDVPQASNNGGASSVESNPGWNIFGGRWSRRCVMALLLFLLLVIEQFRNTTVILTLAMSVFLGEHSGVKYDAIGEWSLLEVTRLVEINSAIAVIAQIPGAILIFKYSSHRYLITTVVISSLLHMLTPIGLHHHSVVLQILLIAETVVAAAVKVAVISVWKDWAPPSERTKLIMFCFLAVFVDCATAPYYHYVAAILIKEEHYYITGTAGLLWAIFWYCSSSQIPENDAFISEKELRYLEDSLPADTQQEIRLRDVPWKDILSSEQLYILCGVFFKAGCSFQISYVGGTMFRLHWSINYDTSWIFIAYSFALVLVPLSSAILADKLLKKSGGEASSIRLKFLCGGLLLQCLLLFGTLFPSDLAKGIFFLLAYLCFAASLPGFITMPFDLSPRYVAIILGFVFTAFNAGALCTDYLMQHVVELIHLQTIGWLFLLDGIISLLCVIFFFLFANYKEQRWSNIPRTSGYQKNPMQENGDGSSQIADEV